MASEMALACGLVAIVDDADVDLLCSHKWHRLVSSGITYARSSMKVGGKYKSVLMHRFLLGPTGANQIDHINRNGLDNRRLNLRIATPCENNRNKGGRGVSGMSGVKYSSGKWIATISPNGEEIFLGKYDSPDVAGAVYNSAAEIAFGEFANVNPCGYAPDAFASIVASKKHRFEKLKREIEILTKGSPWTV